MVYFLLMSIYIQYYSTSNVIKYNENHNIKQIHKENISYAYLSSYLNTTQYKLKINLNKNEGRKTNKLNITNNNNNNVQIAKPESKIEKTTEGIKIGSFEYTRYPKRKRIILSFLNN